MTELMAETPAMWASSGQPLTTADDYKFYIEKSNIFITNAYTHHDFATPWHLHKDIDNWYDT